MAVTTLPPPTAGYKRAAERSVKDAAATKKARTNVTSPSRGITPAQEPPTTVASERDVDKPRLPSKVLETRALPTLPTAQPTSLAQDDYQSIPVSGVLAASFERSRQRWMIDGVFDKVWRKPATKNEVVPGNADTKAFLATGQCRIRIEPHMFEVETWVEKPTPVKRPVPTYTPQATFQQQYRPTHTHTSQHYQQGQARPIQPVFQSTPHLTTQQHVSQNRGMNGAASVANPLLQSPAAGPTQTKTQVQQTAAPDSKPSSDPVISMLAARASSDPELKALMKEVATGKATPEQLRVFQKHIDDLTKVVEQRRKDEEQARIAREQAALKEEQARQQQLQAQRQVMHPVYEPPQPPVQRAVHFQFITPGSNEDRFVFPQHSILEYLSAQHCLASFIVIRKGVDAADRRGLDPATEYWQPVTLLIECAYGRTQPIDNIRKWVKPADEVRRYMEEVMKRCTRVSNAQLAIRLPHRGSREVVDDETSAAEESPSTGELTGSRKGGESVKFVKPPVPAATKKTAAAPRATPQSSGESSVTSSKHGDTITKVDKDGDNKDAVLHTGATVDKQTFDVAPSQVGPDISGVEESASDASRPRRAVRKSVRISEV